MGLTEVPGSAVGHFGQTVARFSRGRFPHCSKLHSEQGVHCPISTFPISSFPAAMPCLVLCFLHFESEAPCGIGILTTRVSHGSGGRADQEEKDRKEQHDGRPAVEDLRRT